MVGARFTRLLLMVFTTLQSKEKENCGKSTKYRDIICRYLISQGADKEALTNEGETAVDLVNPDDYKTMAVLLNAEESSEKERRMSAVRGGSKKEPAWFRKESIQRESGVEMKKPAFCSDEQKCGDRVDIRHGDKDSFSALRAKKGSMWVGDEGSLFVFYYKHLFFIYKFLKYHKLVAKFLVIR